MKHILNIAISSLLKRYFSFKRRLNWSIDMVIFRKCSSGGSRFSIFRVRDFWEGFFSFLSLLARFSKVVEAALFFDSISPGSGSSREEKHLTVTICLLLLWMWQLTFQSRTIYAKVGCVLETNRALHNIIFKKYVSS